MRNYKPTEFVSAMLHSDVIHDKVEFKICSVCSEQKDINDYSKSPRSPDGRRAACKACVAVRATEIYHEKKAERDLYKSMMPI